MKKLTLFLTLSLLTIIGTSTLVKAELEQSQTTNGESVIISQEEDAKPTLEESAVEEPATEYEEKQSDLDMETEEPKAEVQPEAEAE